MSRASRLRLGLFAFGLGATLTACASVTSGIYVAAPTTSNQVKILTCPDRQGGLVRHSNSTGDSSCAYGLENDQAVQVELRLADLGTKSPEATMDAIQSALISGDQSKDLIEKAMNYTEGVMDSHVFRNREGLISRTVSVRLNIPNRSGFRSLGFVVRGPETGPQVIGILKSKDTVSKKVKLDFERLVEIASAN